MIQKVYFTNSKWEKLCGEFFMGWLFWKVAIIMCHSENSSKDWKTYSKLSSILMESHIPHLRFDFSWTGESEWDANHFDSKKWKQDINAAIDYVKSQWIDKIVLFWKWIGWISALMSAASNDSVWGLVLVAPGAENENFIELFDIIKWYSKPVFIIHWAEDKVTHFTNSDKIKELLENCSLEVIRGADHDFSNDREYIKMYNLVAEFLFNIYNTLNK